MFLHPVVFVKCQTPPLTCLLMVEGRGEGWILGEQCVHRVKRGLRRCAWRLSRNCRKRRSCFISGKAAAAAPPGGMCGDDAAEASGDALAPRRCCGVPWLNPRDPRDTLDIGDAGVTSDMNALCCLGLVWEGYINMGCISFVAVGVPCLAPGCSPLAAPIMEAWDDVVDEEPRLFDPEKKCLANEGLGTLKPPWWWWCEGEGRSPAAPDDVVKCRCRGWGVIGSSAICFSLRTRERHTTHLRGRHLWATATWMVFTKHFLQTTLWPQGNVCMVARAFRHTTHWNKNKHN